MRSSLCRRVGALVRGGLVVSEWLAGAATGPRNSSDANWGGATTVTTDLVHEAKRPGTSVFFSTSSTTRNGCHVARVEGERGKEVWVSRDGRPGKSYRDISHPLFSPDGRALAYAVREGGESRFVVNDREGPTMDVVVPDTFAFSADGQRHAYLARRAGRLVVVVDGEARTSTEDDMDPWLQAPVFSKDGSGVAYVESSRARRKMRVVSDGKAGESFDGVALQSLVFSDDGRHLAYAANDRSEGDRWFQVLDGRPGEGFDALGMNFVLGGDGKRFAYTGKRGEQWYLVWAGTSETPIEGMVDRSLTFSIDGRRTAYAIAMRDTRCRLVLDGEPGPIHAGIGGSAPPTSQAGASAHALADGVSGPSLGVLFSPDSRRLAYIATLAPARTAVVLDGKPDRVELSFVVGGMVFSGDSKRLAYGGRQGDKFFLVVDGTKQADYEALGSFGFSPDGRHVVYAARKLDRMVVVLDGQERGNYESIPAGPAFRGDGVLEFLAAEEDTLRRIEVSGL